MKKFFCLLAGAMLLSAGSAWAAPKLVSIKARGGKAVVKVEIPASDRDETNGLSVKEVVLHNQGKTFKPWRVESNYWGEETTVTMKFRGLPALTDSSLSMSINGETVSLELPETKKR